LIARGCVDEPTRKLAADAYTSLTAFVVRWLAEAVNGHQTAEGMDVVESARHLVSVIESLRWPLLFGVYTEHEALDVLDAQLDQIFGGPGTPATPGDGRPRRCHGPPAIQTTDRSFVVPIIPKWHRQLFPDSP
jgi:hypothetical protein